MITFTLVAVLGVLLAIVLKQLFQKRSAPGPARPKEDLANLKITEVRVGDTISIPGAGDDFTDLDFTVDRRGHYQGGGREWVELSGMFRERRVYLEVAEGDQVEVKAVLDPKKITLEELGLSEDELAEMDERQNTADNFEFDGKPWMYRFSKEMHFSRDGQGQARNFYFWEFQEQDGKRFLTIKKFEGEPFTASISTQLNPADITVYRAG